MSSSTGRLREAGCEVRYFRPLKKRPFTLTGRNHRKLVVVDGRVGFTGGFGIAPEWSVGGPRRRRGGTRTPRSRGPSCGRCRWRSPTHWLETGGWLLPARGARAREAGGRRPRRVRDEHGREWPVPRAMGDAHRARGGRAAGVDRERLLRSAARRCSARCPRARRTASTCGCCCRVHTRTIPP